MIKNFFKQKTIGKYQNSFLKKDNPWCIDRVSFEKNHISVKGWAYADETPGIMLFCNNSKPFYSNFNKPRKDLPLIFPNWRNAHHAGFECRFDLVELIELEFILHRNGEPCDKLKSYFFLKENQSVPSSENIKRVTGSTLKGTYLLEGFSTYKKISHIISRDIGFKLDRDSKILDWGCGCGRLSRFLCKEYKELWGSDIDHTAIDWCTKNLGIKTIKLSPLPEYRHPSNFFDLIIGISVMTHLDRENQLKWLREITSSLKIGGLLIISFHGISSAMRALSPIDFETFLELGFADKGANQSLEKVLVETEYYRDTFNTQKYISENWVNGLKVMNFYDSVVGNNQDLVVLKKV
jgi:2-polyprenyl-3-methyl-5-hydroxy-6-metoxy-1,4-benzoquinol methylase